MPKYATKNLEYFKEVMSNKDEIFDVILNKNSHLGNCFTTGLVSNLQAGTRELPIRLQTESKLKNKDVQDIVQKARSDGRIHYLSLQEHDYQVLSWFRDAGAEVIFDIMHSISFYHDNLNDVKSKMRKSYKSLVNKNHNIQIIYDEHEQVIEQCRLLHLKIAGRTTRSKYSWELMARSLIENTATLSTLVENEQLVGYNYFMKDRKNALYASSVVDQGYNGHALMWEAIKSLCNSGSERIYLDKNLQGYQKSKKELNISNYKIGFCNNAEPHFTIRL